VSGNDESLSALAVSALMLIAGSCSSGSVSQVDMRVLRARPFEDRLGVFEFPISNCVLLD